MKQRIGVYICHCGSNISDYVDVEKVREEIAKVAGVALAKTTMFACADSTQKEIKEDIQNHQLDGLVVASCSPTLHLPTFRDVAMRAGMNPYNYVQVNIREQGSWAHSDDKSGATKKAVQLIKSGIARAYHSRALEPIKISALNSVAIIGAGIAGLRAAIELADLGTQVYLVEKDFFVGGRVPQWGQLCSREETGAELVQRFCGGVREKDNIDLLLGTRITKMSGNIGNYVLEVETSPRHVKPDADPQRLQELAAAAVTQVDDEFNFNIVKRKRVYRKYPQASPAVPVVDTEFFKEEPDLAARYADCVDANQAVEKRSLNVGAVIVSTGFDPYEPDKGEYAYKENEYVVTLQEFERIFELSDPKDFRYKGRTIGSIAFIYCVGSCESEGDRQYCSRVCCTRVISVANHVKQKFPDIQNYHLYRQIRTYGKQEILFDDALKSGDVFMKFSEDDPPEIQNENGKAVVVFNDLLTDRETLELEPDLIVLVTGMSARKESREISGILKIPIGRDQFFNEVHPKLRPVETVIDGVFIAGTCQGPKSISESIKSALSSASKAHSLISKGEIELKPTLAQVDQNLCNGCGDCFDVCPFNAIEKMQSGAAVRAKINMSSCKGCGICSPICPEDAIDIIGYTSSEIMGMIDSLMEGE